MYLFNKKGTVRTFSEGAHRTFLKMEKVFSVPFVKSRKVQPNLFSIFKKVQSLPSLRYLKYLLHVCITFEFFFLKRFDTYHLWYKMVLSVHFKTYNSTYRTFSFKKVRTILFPIRKGTTGTIYFWQHSLQIAQGSKTVTKW